MITKKVLLLLEIIEHNLFFSISKFFLIREIDSRLMPSLLVFVSEVIVVHQQFFLRTVWPALPRLSFETDSNSEFTFLINFLMNLGKYLKFSNKKIVFQNWMIEPIGWPWLAFFLCFICWWDVPDARIDGSMNYTQSILSYFMILPNYTAF